MVLMFIGFLATAQNNTANIIQVSQNNNTLQVSFILPSFEMIDTTLVYPYQINEVFKYIQINNDEFGIIDSVGLPQLPQLSFDLFVPYNATDFEIRIISADTVKIGIDKKIMPYQEDINKENPVFDFSMNRRYYSSTGGFCNIYAQLNESFIVFGEQGINVTIFPYQYNPMQDSLTVLNNAVFAIFYNLSQRTTEKYNSTAKNNYLNSLFKNYQQEESDKASHKGRYLMITPPKYESTLTYFANYKRNIGFDVIVVNTNTTGTTATSIKNYIQNRYNNTSTRPDYVLLVGDVDKIPAYEGDGSGTEIDDPLTDLGYSLLEGNDNLADVFLGRFSVSDENGEAELKNIINKTIFMEMNMHRFTKKAKFLAGDETDVWNYNYMINQFKKGHEYVIPYSFEPLEYNCQKLYQPTQSQVVNALNDNPLFYIYSGHGSTTSFAGISFTIGSTQISNATNIVFPFVFSFACQVGNFSKTCIGEYFIRAESKGAVAYFGCSVNSQTNSDVAIEKKIFGDAFLKDEQNLKAIIDVGMRRFTYVSGIRKKVKNRYLKACNLLGDPSFDMKGNGCAQSIVFNHSEIFKSGSEITYRADDFIQNNNDFIIESGANVKLLAGNSIVLKPGFRAEAGSNVEIQIVPCDDGTIQKSFSEGKSDTEQNVIENIIQPQIDEVINSIVEVDKIFYPAIFSVFPNPTSDNFSLAYTLEENSFVKIDLYNSIYQKPFTTITTGSRNLLL